MANRVARVVIVGDDPAAMSVVRLMHMSWERGGTALKEAGLRAEWEIGEHALDGFNLRDTDAVTPFSEKVFSGLLPGREILTRGKAIKAHIRLRLSYVARGGIRSFSDARKDIDLQIRMVTPHHFAAERADVQSVTALLQERDEDEAEPDDFVLLGITDASLDWRASRDIGSGVDQILNPGLLGKVAGGLKSEPRVAIAVTGLERDFASFDGDDPAWSIYGNARRAAWNPRVVHYALLEVLADRPHLQNLLLNDSRFRPSGRWPLTITAVMPCGFLRHWDRINYNPAEPGWIEGSPAIRGERDAGRFEPYCCADPLLTALTGVPSPLQITAAHVFGKSRHPARRDGVTSVRRQAIQSPSRH